MSAITLPAGWSVEMQGLSASVVFTEHRNQLVWCDGVWQMSIWTERGQHIAPASGVPAATSMKEARAAGAAFLRMLEDDA